jgi:AcrR family transcriptional regulator
MVRRRLSREDSRGLTAQRLLDAAKRLIAKKGFEATSIEVVADTAGYSRGAFYSNFSSKNEVLFELLRREQERANVRFEAALHDTLPPEKLRARMGEVYATLYLEGATFLTWTEARMLAARDSKFRVKFGWLMTEKRDHALRLLQDFYQRTDERPSGPLEPLAIGFISLMEGVGLFAASCPNELPPPVGRAILTTFFSAVTRQVHQAE